MRRLPPQGMTARPIPSKPSRQTTPFFRSWSVLFWAWTAWRFFMERFVFHGSFFRRSWSGCPFDRLVSEIHRLVSHSDRLVLRIDRRVSQTDRLGLEIARLFCPFRPTKAVHNPPEAGGEMPGQIMLPPAPVGQGSPDLRANGHATF